MPQKKDLGHRGIIPCCLRIPLECGLRSIMFPAEESLKKVQISIPLGTIANEAPPQTHEMYGVFEHSVVDKSKARQPGVGQPFSRRARAAVRALYERGREILPAADERDALRPVRRARDAQPESSVRKAPYADRLCRRAGGKLSRILPTARRSAGGPMGFIRKRGRKSLSRRLAA
jgi:hypothetical protein